MNHTIYLIRHAKTQANVLGKYIGITDDPLCELGIEELEACIDSGRYPAVDYVFVSPMQRCQQTRERIFGTVPFQVIPELAECNFGFFENKSYEELQSTREYQDWLNHGGLWDFPQGDRLEDFQARCARGFVQAAQIVMDKGIARSALVIHGGTIMAILSQYAPHGASFHDWRVKNCGGFRLVLDPDLWRREQKLLEVAEL